MNTQIFENYETFLKRENKTINGVSKGTANKHTNYVEMNATNEGCWNCIACRSCKDCIACKFCIGCIACENCIDCISHIKTIR